MKGHLDLAHAEGGGWGGYLRSFYFAIVGLSTIGYGDIVASNSPNVNFLESWFSTIIILFGGLMYPALVGGLASLILMLGAERREHDHKLADLRGFMSRESIANATQDRIFKFYNYKWSMQGGVDETKMLQKLPKHLRNSMSRTISGPILESIPFFKGGDDLFVVELVGHLEPVMYLPGDEIIQSGFYGQDMYLVERGRVSISEGRGSEKKGLTFGILSDGDYFGEAGLLQDTPRSHTCTSIGYTDLFKLTRSHFRDAMGGLNVVEREQCIQRIERCHQEKLQRNMNVMDNIDELIKRNRDTMGFTASNTKQINQAHWQHPDSKFRLGWDMLILFIVTYNLVAIPFRLGFSSAEGPSTFVFDWILDAFLVQDVVFNLRYFAFVVEGQVYDRKKDIRRAYINAQAQEAGGFIPHLLCSLPYDLLAPILAMSTSIPLGLALAACRIPKLVRARWLLPLVARFEYFIEKTKFLISVGTIKIAKLFVGVFIVSHWTARYEV